MEESKRIKGVYLKADTTNGVYEIESSDLTESDEVCKPSIFLASLKDMEDGECAIGFFDGNTEEIYDEIKNTYGIN